MTDQCVLASDIFDPAQCLANFTASATGAGAVASFTGLVRSTSKADAPVTALFLDHHPRLTLTSMQAIHAEALDRFDLNAAYIIHRCGLVAAGEPIVFVAAASSYRRAAFGAVDCMMDRLKTEAVFWKREDGPTGTTWIEPTAEDYAARERWD